MSPLDIFRAVNEKRGVGDLDGAIAVLRDHPEFFRYPHEVTLMLYYAARAGEVSLVAELIRCGADINAVEHPFNQSRAIGCAARGGSIETVRLLINSGAEVNWGWEIRDEQSGRVLSWHPVLCTPLQYAIHEGHADIAKLLVDSGALINAVDKLGKTHLDWAEQFGHAAIADYLRSKGAKHARELPGYVPPPPKPPVVCYADSVLGYSQLIPFTPVLPETVPVAIHVHQGESCYLFTQGLSERPMTVPPGGEAYQYAELLLPFSLDLLSEDDGSWLQDKSRWLVQWLHRVAQIPFETNTWLGGQWGIISNEEPPQPLSEFTPMTCWLLLAEKEPLTRLELDDGRSVVFYTLLPIHTTERDFVLREGLVALLQRFADNDMPDYIVPDRPSVV